MDLGRRLVIVKQLESYRNANDERTSLRQAFAQISPTLAQNMGNSLHRICCVTLLAGDPSVIGLQSLPYATPQFHKMAERRRQVSSSWMGPLLYPRTGQNLAETEPPGTGFSLRR